MEMLAGWRAVSLAGNDKGRVYVIRKTAGNMFSCRMKTEKYSGRTRNTFRL